MNKKLKNNKKPTKAILTIKLNQPSVTERLATIEIKVDQVNGKFNLILILLGIVLASMGLWGILT
jgi:hypothetical protein